MGGLTNSTLNLGTSVLLPPYLKEKAQKIEMTGFEGTGKMPLPP